MEHKGTVELSTERLLLRRFQRKDAESMYRNWASDPDVTQFLTWPAHKTVSMTERTLQEWIDRYQNASFYQWAIVPNDLGEPIGSISVVSVDEDAETAEIAYCIGRKWWHQGYVSEAARAVIYFLFHDVRINRLMARHDTQNPNSGAVMQKCGMHFEGILRSAAQNNQGTVDVAVYSMLADEFEGNWIQ